CVREYGRESGEPSDEGPPAAAGRGGKGHIRNRSTGGEGHSRRLHSRDADRAPPRRQMAAFHATYDVLLTPALATLPPKLGWIDMMMDDVHEYWRRVFHFSPFTVCFNLTGQPAIVLPLARTDTTPERTATGFPIAVQLVARYGDEATLFRLAAQL